MCVCVTKALKNSEKEKYTKDVERNTEIEIKRGDTEDAPCVCLRVYSRVSQSHKTYLMEHNVFLYQYQIIDPNNI